MELAAAISYLMFIMQVKLKLLHSHIFYRPQVFNLLDVMHYFLRQIAHVV